MLDRLFDQFDRLALEEAVYKVCERACLRVRLPLLIRVRLLLSRPPCPSLLSVSVYLSHSLHL